MITIQELLFNRGLTKSKNKTRRHKDGRHKIYTTFKNRKDKFLAYQNSPVKRKMFNGVDFIVSLLEKKVIYQDFGVYQITNREKFADDFSNIK